MLGKESFRTIRTYDGSQQGGFEELICQLAHLSPPPNAKSFIRKEGAGGDAGVECFWILEDGTEHAWQAKYFLDALLPSKWSQINKSVETAIKKHPNLKKYYVCTPLNRTDTRSTGPGGNQTTSVLDEWNDYVEKWKKLASSQNMEVEFEYWGAHEILSPLQSDDPAHTGRALYWFKEVILSNDKLKRCIDKQKKTLGERYTPEFHVDLPIARILFGLINGDLFWDELNEKALEWNKYLSAFCSKIVPDDVASQYASLTEVLTTCKQAIYSVIISRDHNQLINLQHKFGQAQSLLNEYEKTCRNSAEACKSPDEHSRSYYDEVLDFRYDKHSALNSFLNSDFVKANITKAVLVTGEAGIGKSHLFCDFAKEIINDKAPAILMLGQHYRGGNPLGDLLDLLDLKEHTYETVLGAIDAAGEASKSNAILLVDAINEGSYRNEWEVRIASFLEEIKRFPHISVAISCRSRFDELLIPKSIEQNDLLRITHEGFKGHEHKAASIYLTRHGIAKPTTPITAPEFSNPLFLKTCATALKQLGEKSWPKGYQGASKLFEIYLSSLEKIISRTRDTELNDRLCQKSLEAIANEMFPDHLFGLPWDKATKTVNAVDTTANPKETLFQTLLREGALAEDIEYIQDDDGNTKQEPIVRFAYERFCDYFVAQKLCHNIEAPCELFDKKHPIGRAVSEGKYIQFQGILESLSIIIPEKFGVEFWDLLPDKLKAHPQAADLYFFDTLPYKDPSSFSDRTHELFNSLRPLEYRFQNRKLDLLVQFATEPSHPWNANYLHNFLCDKKMPERDAFWSIFIAKNDFEEDDDQSESPIRSVIEWATFGDLTFVEKEQAFLSLVTLVWFTTTTNRKTRDQATKAAARLFALYPSVIIELLTHFQDVDDLYLQERLYASIYGGLCNAETDDYLKTIATYVFEIQFKDKSPTIHLLLRDYARGIIELAKMRNHLDNAVRIDNCRPPYQSNWPLDFPSDDEFNHLGTKIEQSIFSDDFGIYTLSTIHEWSPTSLDQTAPETQSDTLERLAEKLGQSSKDLFDEATKITQAYDNRVINHTTSGPHPFFQALSEIFENQNSSEDNVDEFDDSKSKYLKDEIFARTQSKKITDPDNPTYSDVEAIWDNFFASLNDSEKDLFKGVEGFWRNGNITLSFDRQLGQRWICKRSFDLGWAAELFQEFESSLPYSGRSRPKIERIGKKYQYIAFYEFLAHLADNVHYKGDEGYSDTPKPSRYNGPWQLRERDIDPTQWLRDTFDSGWDEWNENVWWRPFDYKFAYASDEIRKQWCADPSNLPKLEEFILNLDESNNEWYSLSGFSKWREKKISSDDSKLSRDIWFRINSIIVTQDNLKRLQKQQKNKDYISPDLVSPTSTGYQVYLREYPWHPSVTIKDRFEDGESWGRVKSSHIVPYAEYEKESGNDDLSAETSIRFYIPSVYMIENMHLCFDRNNFNRWLDDSGKLVFFDPSIEFNGPSFALLDCQSIDNFLTEKNLVLVWLIGGEKMVVDESTRPVKGRMVFNTMLWTTGNGTIHSKQRHYMDQI